MKTSRIQPLFFLLVVGAMLLCGKVMAQSTPYVLEGLVTDDSDNWLAGAIVTLNPIGIQAITGPNGNFTLNIDPADINQIAFTLHVARSGHIARSIPIDSLDITQGMNDLLVKVEIVPVSDNLIGFTTEMVLPGGNTYDPKTQFHVYIPSSVKTVRAAFFISRHGLGNTFDKSEILKEFAEKEQVALVGMLGDPVQRGVNPVSKVDEHIQRLSDMSGHPELPNVPIMTFGHSNGTGFSGSWPRDLPERTIAWVSYHPGSADYLQYDNTEKIPAMVMLGGADTWLADYSQDTVVTHMRRTRDAAMNAMLEGGVGHYPQDANSQNSAWTFVTEFLKSAMRVRLTADGTLKPVNLETGWLGEIYDREKEGRQNLDIASYAEFTGDKSTANWFPDETFALHWQCYGITTERCENLPDPVTVASFTTEFNGLKAYMNQVNQQFVIQRPNAGEAAYSILNYAGQVVLSGEIYKRSSAVDVSGLESGVYLVRVNNETESLIAKIIKP